MGLTAEKSGRIHRHGRKQVENGEDKNYYRNRNHRDMFHQRGAES
jgi:hypothetical protein